MTNKKYNYTKQQLLRNIILDLIIDIKCARRDSLKDYENECINCLLKIYKNRHNLILNKWGYVV